MHRSEEIRRPDVFTTALAYVAALQISRSGVRDDAARSFVPCFLINPAPTNVSVGAYCLRELD